MRWSQLPLLAVLLCCSPACRAPEAARDPREVARLAVEIGDHRRAVNLWTQLWQASGHTDLEAALEAARAVARTGDRPGALAILRHHVSRFPDAAAAWSELGAQELAAGASAAAEDAFRTALTLAPADPRAAAGLAQLLRERGEPEAALEVLREADAAARAAAAQEGLRGDLRGDLRGKSGDTVGEDPRLALERGRAALAVGRYRDALPAFRAASSSRARLRPASADLLALAAAFTALPDARWADAEPLVAWLAEARAEAPNDAALPRAVAEVYHALGRPVDTVDPARDALARDPGDLEALALLLAALRELRRTEEYDAAVAHAEGLELTPEERAALGLSP